MCGIAGVFDARIGSTSDELADLVSRMSETLQHRGPDDRGTWTDASAGIALGHRRLSIIDLTPAGSQPMRSPSGRFVVTFNGEVYNFRELRKELQRAGVAFRGSSDTEVLVAGLDVWGLEATLARLDGMFAFGVWDHRRRELSLARDRFGEKPLYWGRVGGRLLFASELRAIAAVAPGLAVNPEAVADVLAYKCVRGPKSIYRHVHRLLPGHTVRFRSDGGQSTHCYWSARGAALAGLGDPLQINEEQAARELESRLSRTVSSRMVADVPVGAFLSGGVDSAGIAAFMVDAASGPVRTYTVGLDDPRFDESDRAAVVAERLGTEHHALRVSPSDVLDLIPRIAEAYDEPFADSSQLPTLLVSSFAVGQVKVALTGDGGDEVFGGYNRHVFGDRLSQTGRALPASLRRELGQRLQGLTPETVESWFRVVAPLLPPRWRVRLPADKARKLGRLLAAPDRDGAFHALVTDPGAATLTREGVQVADRLLDVDAAAFSQAAMLADAEGYLPDDILTKIDRAAMSVSLETRAPYLDHALFEWAWRLPLAVKIRGGVGKRLLREVVEDRISGLDLAQVKSGFGIPIGDWLRGDLRSWVEDVLATSDDYIRQEALRRMWRDHLTGRRDHTHELWSVLQFRSWLARH